METATMDEYIQEALRQGFIRPSTSPASASLFFVAKMDGGLMSCIDYKGLNQIIKKFHFLLPLMPAILEQLCSEHIFTKLDLRSMYNLTHIWEGDIWKTVFSTTTGHYAYWVRPYGLAITLAVFQSFVSKVFQDKYLLHKYLIVYTDDMLVYSLNLEDRFCHVSSVSVRVQKHSLYVKAEKWQFHLSYVSFLEYVIMAKGVCIEEWKVPDQFSKGCSLIPLPGLLTNC